MLKDNFVWPAILFGLLIVWLIVITLVVSYGSDVLEVFSFIVGIFSIGASYG